MTDRTSVRLGLVGAGAIGQLAHLPVLASQPGVRIAGLVTADLNDTEAIVLRWPIERAYESLDDMIRLARLDALLVLTPKHAHREYVEQALAAGLDVYCEKPMATTLDDARAMVAAADRADGLFMVGLNRRYSEVYRLAHAQFETSPPRFIVGQKHRPESEYRATLENGIHMLDLLRWFCGEATDVQAYSWAPDPYREDGVSALIRFDSGASATFSAARCAGEWDERLEIYGDATTVRVIAPDSVTTIRDHAASTVTMRSRASGFVDITRSAGFVDCLQHFIDCIRTRRAPLTDGREAYRSQELMEQVLVAAGLPTTDQVA